MRDRSRASESGRSFAEISVRSAAIPHPFLLSVHRRSDAKLVISYSELAVHCRKDELTRRLNDLDATRQSPHFWRKVDAANEVPVEIDELKAVLNRLDSLNAQIEAVVAELARPSTRQLDFIERSFDHATQQLDVAERELMRMGGDAKAHVLVAITPIGSSTHLRDLLFDTYRGWSKWQGHRLQLLSDPLMETDPIFFALKGAYACGYLQYEHGVHRLRTADEHEAVRVMVAPWSHALTEPRFGNQRALKKPGKFGEKIRSQVEVIAAAHFVLQNTLTIGENREMAREIASSWQQYVSSDAVVRRYDLEPFLVKDHLTGITSGSDQRA